MVEEKGSSGPKLSNLRSYRWTLADGLPPIKEDWETDAGEIESEGNLIEWTGKVIFGEKWASADLEEEAEESMLHAEMQGLERKSRGRDAHHRSAVFCPMGSVTLPGDLVLRDILEKNIVDDLSGKPLDGVRVTAAKHEELTEMYRRQVWVERPIADCYRPA